MSSEDERERAKRTGGLSSLSDLFGATGEGANALGRTPGMMTEDMLVRALLRAARSIQEEDQRLHRKPYQETSAEQGRILSLGPVVHASTFQLTPYEGYVRIAFGERLDSTAPTQFRTGVVLPDFMAFQLWELLGQTDAVREGRRQVAATAAAESTDNGDRHE